jgi:hypothetical protein
MQRDPAFQLLQRRTALTFAPIGLKLLLSEPDMMLFFDRTAGHMVLAALLHAALSDPANPHPAIPYADVGDRFGVSRTHVRELLATAEETGLVKLQARGGHRVEILPRPVGELRSRHRRRHVLPRPYSRRGNRTAGARRDRHIGANLLQVL